MEVTKTAAIVGMKISEIESRIDEKQLRQFMEKICRVEKIYACGAGRLLLMLRCFTMRLIHIGYDVYVVGGTTTPAFEESDLLIVGAVSRETTNPMSIADRAKNYGGAIAVRSIFPESPLGKHTDALVGIPTYTDKLPRSDNNKKSVLPGRNIFEISMLVLSDTMIMSLVEEESVVTNTYFARHANLE